MKKKWFLRLAASFVVVSMLMAGCSSQNNKIDRPNSSENVFSNPFEENKNNTEILGSIDHGPANPKLDANDKRLPLCYKGNEMKIDYKVKASGKAKNVGFLVFIDGIAQPYKFNNTAATYEYMHIINLKEDDKDTPFTFVFTPVTGKKGETHNVAITSIYNPAFIPDMKKTTSYGDYHSILDSHFSMIFEQDAEPFKASAIPKYDCLRNVRQSTEPVTKDMLESLNSFFGDVSVETLNSSVFVKQLLGGTKAENHDNLQIQKSGTLHVTFQIVGHPGVRYKNTFYLNHQALTDGKNVSLETTLTKGNVLVIEADLDLSKLKDFNTFYVISVPCNPDDFPKDVITMEKTESILLYK